MIKQTFEFDLTPEMYAEVEEAYQSYYGKSIQDVFEVLLKQSYLLGDCPFLPEVRDLTVIADREIEEIRSRRIDWRDRDAYLAYIDSIEEED